MSQIHLGSRLSISSTRQLTGLQQVSRLKTAPPRSEIQSSPSPPQERTQPTKAPKTVLGSKAQIQEILHEIQTLEVQTLTPPPLGKMETLKKYLKKPLGWGKSTGTALNQGVLGGVYRNLDHRKLAQKILASGKSLQSHIELLQRDTQSLSELIAQVRSEQGQDDPDELKVSRLLSQAGEILERHELGLPQGLLNAINSPQLPDKVNDGLSLLKSATELLPYIAQKLQAEQGEIKTTAQTLKKEARTGLVGETTSLTQKVSPLISMVNLGAQLKMTHDTVGTLFSKEAFDVMGKGAGKVVTGTPMTVVSGVGGGLQILTEGAELIQNYSKRRQALSRMEMAQAVLASPQERQAQIGRLQKKLAQAQSSHWYTRKAGRLKSVQRLEQKLQGLQALDRHLKTGATPSLDKAKLVARQIVKRGDTKFKAVKIAKNLLGIAAGAIGIAVAVGALATPVGWIAAGVALTATVGCFIFVKYKISQRKGKIQKLQQAQQGAQQKLQSVQQERAQTREQIDHMKHNLAQKMERYYSSGPDIDSEAFQLKEREFQEVENMIARLEEHHGHLGDTETTLRAQAEKVGMALLAVSPEHASDWIYTGATARPPDPLCHYLAQEVLHITPEHMERQDALKVLQRGMTLDPRF